MSGKSGPSSNRTSGVRTIVSAMRCLASLISSSLIGRTAFGGGGQTRNDFFRNDQHMHRRLRIHIMERNCVVIFPDDLGRNFASNYFLENGHGKSEVRDQRNEHFKRSLVVTVSRSRMKQTISSRKESQARVQTLVQRRCFTHGCKEQSCKLSTPVSISALIRFSRRSKNASS